MFYRLIMIGIFYLALGHSSAYAVCAGIKQQNLSALLSNNSVSFDAISPTGWMIGASPDWHEIHEGVSSGNLWEVGGGIGHAVHPTTKVGTWSIQNDGTPNANVSYTYDSAGTFTFEVYFDGTDYRWWDGTTCKAIGVIDGTTAPLP